MASCDSVVPLDQGILATTPGTGCAPPSRPPAESCRAGRSDPDRGHGASLEVPVTGLPGPGGDRGPGTWAPRPAAARPARPVRGLS